MTPSFFCWLYHATYAAAAVLPVLYLLQPVHHEQLPALWRIIAALTLVTVPRLLLINTVLHRGIAHAAFSLTSKSASPPSVSALCTALSSLSLLPYSPARWARRHRHFHSLSPIPVGPAAATQQRAAADAGQEADAEGDSEAEEDVLGLRAALPSIPQSLWALWRLWLQEDAEEVRRRAAAVTGDEDDSSQPSSSHLLPAFAFNCIAASVLTSVLAPSVPAPSVLSTLLLPALVLSVLSLSQAYLWLSSAVLLNHALAFPFVGYQLHLNAHHNSLLVSLATCGGGFLNTHHAAPSCPFHTQLPFELDPNSLILRLLRCLGLLSLCCLSSPLPPPLSFPSLILSGWVSHTRMWPFYHRFRYPVSFMRTELSPSLPVAMDSYWLLSSRPQRRWWEGAPAIARLSAASYLSVARVKQLLVAEGLPASAASSAAFRVHLVTCWRYLGYSMNPISYYVCYEGDDQQLVGMVSEVHNTPWGERCWYAHVPQLDGRWLTDSKHKAMHVSPFMSMHYRYQLRFTLPAETWTVRWCMHYTRCQQLQQHSTQHTLSLSSPHPAHPPATSEPEDERHFKAFLELVCQPVSQWRLCANLSSHPLQSARVVFWIYYQAAILFVKRKAVYYSHPQ